jgi:hypothetical protein
MAIFGNRQPRWEKTFRLRGHFSAAKGLLAVLFWVWGGLGLIFNLIAVSGLTDTVGIRGPTDLTAACLLWIGGLVLFGLGALLAQSDFDGERPIVDDPSEPRHQAL